MSEGEEHAWSSRRAHELVEDEGDLLLPPSDKRSSQVRSVLERILAAVEEEERDVLNIREIVSIPGGWKPTHNHAPSLPQVGDEERDLTYTKASSRQASDEVGGPGCATETDYLVDRERECEKEEADAKLSALSRRARRRKQRQLREQVEEQEDEPDNVIEVRGWKVYLVESVRLRPVEPEVV